MHRSLRAGFSLIETLAAAAILGVSLTALVGMFFFSLAMTQASDDTAIASNLTRQTIEAVKALGFKYAVDGTSTVYYDKDGLNAVSTADSNSYFTLTLVINSDRLAYNPETGTYTPADLALRTVEVTVIRKSDSKALASAATYLTRSGI